MKQDDVSYIEAEIDALRALASAKAAPTRPVAAAACAPLPDYAPCTGAPLGAACGVPRRQRPRAPAPRMVGHALRVIGSWARVRAYRTVCALGRAAVWAGKVRINGDLLAGWIMLAIVAFSAYACSQKIANDGAAVQRRVGSGHLSMD